MRYFYLLLSLIFLSLPGLWASGKAETEGHSGRIGYGEENLSVLKSEILSLGSRGTLPSEREEAFLRYFAPGGVPGSFRLASFDSGGRKLVLYHFRPEQTEPAGFVYLFHGYLDHTLSNVRLIAFLLEQGYEVAGFDLPGHGLSGGEPVDIDHFSEYADALEDFLALQLPGEGDDFLVVAHSTGCSMVMEYLKTRENPFSRIVMASPLIYSVGWRFTGFGVSLAEPFTDHIFRRFSDSTQDEVYADFVRNRDPFQSREVPFSWVRAYLEWNRDIRRQPVRDDLVFHILQGDRDSVVDYRKNIPFLQDRYPRSRILYYEDAMHSLFNEHDEVRTVVFRDVLTILQSTLE